MRILVCGGREFGHWPGHNAPQELKDKAQRERDFIYSALYKICDDNSLWHEPDQHGNTLPNCTIISGEARGVDTVATDWAVVNWTGYEGYPADWDTHGKSAGYIRNKKMLTEGKPDIVLAFPGGKGTAMMVDIARKAGVEVIIVEV